MVLIMKTVLLQSNYIPWKGYFDLIESADIFIFHDDLTYTKGDWRNRNQIQTINGKKWLTIPCGSDQKRLINEVRVDKVIWQEKHFNLIKSNYKSAPFWDYCLPLLNYIYFENNWTYLSELNQKTIKKIATEFLFINTIFENSERFNLKSKKQDRVLELLISVNATEYISGPSGKDYLDEKMFDDNHIKLTYFNYENYPTYQQINNSFDHLVSVIDLLMCTGPAAREYLLTLSR